MFLLLITPFSNNSVPHPEIALGSIRVMAINIGLAVNRSAGLQNSYRKENHYDVLIRVSYHDPIIITKGKRSHFTNYGFLSVQSRYWSY